MARKSYPTDLNDMEWEILAPLIPPAKLGGHPRTTDMRAVCNLLSLENGVSMGYATSETFHPGSYAIYYYLKTGCQWDMQRARLSTQAQRYTATTGNGSAEESGKN